MKRVNAFLLILIASLTALIALTIVGFAMFTSAQSTQYPSGWMGEMWGMMGQSGVQQTSVNPLLPYFGAIFTVLIAVTIVGIGGLAYYIAFPQIKTGITQPIIQNTQNQTPFKAATPYESVVKTLTDEERKIIEVLTLHDGKYLQKYIRKETGLSRLKTHRIIARLAEREIVSLEKTGNTNQVFLANWLQQEQP